ncbi:alkaline phosphatase family protein [Hymenobacter gummosus]|uniref:Alkaline phosphatase family protein n=2 Tax=Hymenobacter gummosus TaxID=1776032 RepID=A0A3S0JEW3_9BACT|nr:alkaline phosphatase family protein [Hymenobacter gummosus]
MVGYSAMREVMLWVQTSEPTLAQIEYWERGKPEVRHRTLELETSEETSLTAHLLADEVQPGRRYEYALYLNRRKIERPYPLEFQTQELWQWRKDPPDFRLALGSCNYVNEPAVERPGAPYGGDYRIFSAIDRLRPDVMLWLGDNVYLREVDWHTRTGIRHRYSHTRALRELQPLLGHTHHYAMWDDHDYGPNDSDRSYAYKQLTLDAFKQFWANPNYGQGGGGITGTFEWNDVQFFLLDDRWLRSSNHLPTAAGSYLGDSQLQWLVEALAASSATFKVVAVGGQVLNPAKVFENYSNYQQERARLLAAISSAGIKGVVFLSGDRHHTELTRMERPGTYPLYDLTVSPLTSAPSASGKDENNYYRVTNTLTTQRNFAIVDVTGPRFDRRLNIRILDVDGKQLWTQELSSKELK